MRGRATTAVAASAAEEAYRLSDGLPDWRNAVSDEWREHLAHVWDFLAGDSAQHYALSGAIASFLTSPLNHNEGQDGPDDFDRPQTIASFSAVASAVMWGVDFAVSAVGQIFECLDLKHGDDFTAERAEDVAFEIRRARAVVERVVAAAAPGSAWLTADLLDAIRH